LDNEEGVDMKERTIKLLDDFITRKPDLDSVKSKITDAIESIVKCVQAGGKLLVCGNGGSAADSEHLAGEFNKSFILKRKIDESVQNSIKEAYPDDADYFIANLQQGVPTIPLVSFCGFNTAYLNDCEPKMLFAQGVNALGKKGDILIGISTSGNSANVLNAIKLAKVLGLKTIALTGETGGKMRDEVDILINAPSKIVYIIQEYHLPIYHIICLGVESELFIE